ncbi:MAG: hypothetical protein ACRCZF_10830 [Gemmataceae bacterium]
MKNQLTIFVLTLLNAVSNLQCPAYAQKTELSREEFIDQYESQVHSLYNDFRHAHGTYKYEVLFGDKKTSLRQCTFHLDGLHFEFRTQFQVRHPDGRITDVNEDDYVCRNDRYLFTIAGLADQFKIKECYLLSPADRDTLILPYLPIAYNLLGRTYLEVLKDNSTTWLRGSRVTNGDHQLLKCEIEHRFTSARYKGRMDSLLMRLTLDSRYKYACTELQTAQSHQTNRGRLGMTRMDYEIRNGQVALKGITNNNCDDAECLKSTILNSYNITMELNSRPSPIRNRLSDYGLPEPVGIEPIARPMNTLWYWLLGGAGFFAVVSVLLYRLKKRPEATA